MYEDHFHLQQTPFSIAPDPAFLYLSEGHREALAHLTYGFSHGGFVLITGEVGTGKTTLLRNLIKQTPEELDVAFVLNPRLTVHELLETLCDELGVAHPQGSRLSVKQYIDALNRHLLATHRSGRGTVVIIDEAQNLSPAVLEQIRLLTNLETDKRKLLRIILIGQPELAELLDRTDLRQLAQRITARYHLQGLGREDTYAYVVHRLARAGGNPNLFTRPALHRLYGISGGIPRIVNLVADRAMLGAYAEGGQRVSRRLVNRAAAEVFGKERRLGRWLAGGAAAALATGAASAYLLLPQPPAPQSAPLEPPGRTAPATPTDGAVSQRPEQDVPSLTGEAAGAEAEAEAQAGAETADRLATPAGAAPPETVEIQQPDLPAYQTQRQAYRAVLERWDVDMESWSQLSVPCNFAPSVGLQCLAQTGSWSDIRRLNLPVILELWGQETVPYYAAVTRLDNDTVDLSLAGQQYTVTPADLQDAWFGSYVVLWQMPPNYSGTLKRGDRHPSVRWLREQLQTLGIEVEGSNDPAVFDAALQDAVLSFQRDEQLLTDGVVGPATWIRLADRANMPAPKLDGQS